MGTIHQVPPESSAQPPDGTPPRPERYRPGWGDLLGTLAILATVAPVGLWLLNHGLPVPLGMKTTVGMLGLLCSLIATQLMLLLVILLARIPWVERAWGHDRLARQHRWIGFASFWFMMGHIVAQTLERVSRDWSTAWQRTYEIYIVEPWMLAATVGTVLILGVMITSMRWARRRLRFESWHLLHLYTYLGLIFILPHMLVTGPEFHAQWARTCLWAEYILAAACILLFRLGLPLYRSLYHRLRVEQVSTEAPGVVSVSLTGRRLDRLHAKSGQFFIWRFMDGPGWTRGHPYALSAAPQRDRLRISIRESGDGSARAVTLQPGTRALIEGPYGTMTARQRRWPKMLLIAAGIGITPLRALLEDTPYDPGEATLFYRFSSEADRLFTTELHELATRRGVELVLLPGVRGPDGSWLPADYGAQPDEIPVLRHTVPDLVCRDIYVCGPPPWASAVHATLRRAGVHEEDIHTEVFAW
jgi:predicted ferric reductase